MNMIQLEVQMQQMLAKCLIDKEFARTIMNVIVRYYAQVSGFYEEHAIAVFEHFLKTQTLDFKIKPETQTICTK